MATNLTNLKQYTLCTDVDLIPMTVIDSLNQNLICQKIYLVIATVMNILFSTI